MKMKKLTMSIKEFEANAPSHMVIEFLHVGEWLPVDGIYTQDESIVIDSDEQDYVVSGNITIRWSVDED